MSVLMSSPVRKALGYVSLRWKDPIVCESCGNDFKCGATLTGCWCMNVKLTDEIRADLRQRYTKCLCKACLEKQVQGRKANEDREEPLT